MADTFDSITRSLGRTTVLTPPPPPAFNDAVARLQSPAQDLADVFIRRAGEAKMHVLPADPLAIGVSVARCLVERDCKTAVYTDSPLMARIGLADALRANGIDARAWTDTTLDATYEVDAGITDVWRAVAETGSIVIKSSAAHGRAVSLVPPIHVALVERSQIVPDLVDVLRDAQREGTGAGIVMITGPSKTADIEMNLVVGVHGPGEVVVFVID